MLSPPQNPADTRFSKFGCRLFLNSFVAARTNDPATLQNSIARSSLEIAANAAKRKSAPSAPPAAMADDRAQYSKNFAFRLNKAL